jgi:hypothetical protein
MKKQLTFLCILVLIASACKKDVALVEEPEIIEPETLDQNVAAVIPHIYIDIAGNAEVVSKDVYLKGAVKVDGNGQFQDLSAVSTSIKGRGNSTWNKPKKPYRLKLDNKTSILGLPAAKNWVLLANYQDYTLMLNAVAMKVGEQLGMPYTNKIIPVDLTINGKYLGSYTLTQQVEIDPNRVAVGDDGVLLELDKYFDEEFQFKSAKLDLPVMIKSDVESDAHFNKIKNEFQDFEDLLAAPNFPANNYGNSFDKKQLVNYMIVNNLTGNLEINHPGSVYIHKAKGGKYTMGPIWDYDWGYGMDETSRTYFQFNDIALFKEYDDRKGAAFFKTFLKDKEVRDLYKMQWKSFKDTQFESLLAYIEKYAAQIRESQKKDYELWKVGTNNLPRYKADLKTYLRKRAHFIDQEMKTL